MHLFLVRTEGKHFDFLARMASICDYSTVDSISDLHNCEYEGEWINNRVQPALDTVRRQRLHQAGIEYGQHPGVTESPLRERLKQAVRSYF